MHREISMIRFRYTVDGINDENSRVSAEDIIKNNFSEARDIEISEQSVSFSLPIRKRDSSEVDECLRKAFKNADFEILGDCEVKHGRGGKKEKPVRMVPLALAVSLSVICASLTFIATYFVYEFSGHSQTPMYQLQMPQYIYDLLKLDTAFKNNSYDGIDEEAMGEAILDAYISATGDMYAEYLNSDEYAAYFDERSGEFVGIGVSIVNSKIDVGGIKYSVLEIISVFKDSPALDAGVSVGDCIISVNDGEKLVLVDTLGYTNSLEVMLGESGTEANFVVFRPSKEGYEEIEFKIKRRKVESESVTYKVSQTDSRVGIVSITGFDETTAPQFESSVEALMAKGCDKFVFDVRNNPGGALDSIEAVLSYFLERDDVLIHIDYGKGNTDTHYVKPKKYKEEYSGYNVDENDIGKYKGLDCIVLTNENTASAAELFTATLRDYKIAETVGVKTYGKGCMQTIIPLGYYSLDGGLKVTTAMYFSQSKEVYHGTGIEPDHKIDLSEDAKKINFFLLPEDKDDQLQKAIEEILK